MNQVYRIEFSLQAVYGSQSNMVLWLMQLGAGDSVHLRERKGRYFCTLFSCFRSYGIRCN